MEELDIVQKMRLVSAEDASVSPDCIHAALPCRRMPAAKQMQDVALPCNSVRECLLQYPKSRPYLRHFPFFPSLTKDVTGSRPL
jgi:hypothetical protein